MILQKTMTRKQELNQSHFPANMFDARLQFSQVGRNATPYHPVTCVHDCVPFKQCDEEGGRKAPI